MKADAPGGSGPGDPGLGQLFGLLTSDPTPDELSGRTAAATMFRENFKSGAPSGRRRSHRRQGHRRAAPPPSAPPAEPPSSGTPRPGARRPGGRRRGARRIALLSATAVVVMVGGFAGAAYSAVLPAPVQHIAYHVLGFAGVPDARHGRAHRPAARHSPPAPQPSSSAPTAGPSSPAAPTRSPKRGTGSPSPSGRPKPFQPPPPSGPLRLVATAAHGQIAPGAVEKFTAWLTRPGGHSVQGGQLALIEHAAGQSGWRTAGHATTGPSGHAVLTISGLTVSAEFRVTGPDGAQSQPVRVVVLLPVSFKASAAAHGTGVELKARCALADPGDRIVLQVRSGKSWVSKRIRRLDAAGRASFAVRPRPGGREYRVVLYGTVAHGRTVSSTVTVP